MTQKEQCIELINSFDENQLPNIIFLLSSLKDSIDEAVDEAFCSALYDKETAEDDGYRMSSEQLKQKYGL